MINIKLLGDLPSVINMPVHTSKHYYFSVDNRKLDSESIFIAIIGERFNPLEHLDKVIDRGCEYVVYEKNDKSDEVVKDFRNKIQFIEVNNITKFIQESASLVASCFRAKGGKIIAISGSNGKTTTKEMLFHLLSDCHSKDKIICTQKNNNNHLGVPFTLYQINKDTRFAIIELGSNHPGEIEFLCKIVQPQYGVTTNIGDTHLEFFETRENVYKEESVLYKYCSETFYINMDDEYLKRLHDHGQEFGEEASSNKLELIPGGIRVNDIELSHETLTGKHNFINMAVAFIIARDMDDCSVQNIIKSVKTFKTTPNRSQWIERGNQKVFLDAYNANPSSMRVSIAGFQDFLTTNKISYSDAAIIIGDMNELGTNEATFHIELGKFLQEHSFKNCFFVGRFAEDYLAGFGDDARTYSTSEEVRNEYEEVFGQYKYIFIKGSRSLQLEVILDIK